MADNSIIVNDENQVPKSSKHHQYVGRLIIFILQSSLNIANAVFCIMYMIQSFTEGIEDRLWSSRIAIPVTIQCALSALRSTIRWIYLERKNDNKERLRKICHRQGIPSTILFVIFGVVFIVLLGDVIFKEEDAAAVWLPIACAAVTFLNCTMHVFVQGTHCFTHL